MRVFNFSPQSYAEVTRYKEVLISRPTLWIFWTKIPNIACIPFDHANF